MFMPRFARLDQWELASHREMAGMTIEQFAAKMGVTPQQLTDMEAGREVIPARFDDDIVQVMEDALDAMDDPGPLPAKLANRDY